MYFCVYVWDYNTAFASAYLLLFFFPHPFCFQETGSSKPILTKVQTQKLIIKLIWD